MGPVGSRISSPGLAAALAVGLTLGGLVVGFEPIGNDPDLLYRPIKAELARSLRRGELPFWSDRLGLGVPLLAESHVAALYPPNVALYRLLDVAHAYRLAMWGHYLALVATTFLYARDLGITPWGSALAALAFTLCGFQAAHACHEPFYHALPYLPLALYLTRRFVADGRLAWLATLALALGAQWTLGHFQIQSWTNGLVLLLGAGQVMRERRPWWRAPGLVAAVAWGVAIAALQLVATWDLTRLAGFQRPYEDLASFLFPPAHWAQLALPGLFLGLGSGPGDDYWSRLGTTGTEACFYVGTVPLILAFVGSVGGDRGTGLRAWRALIPITWVLAALPSLWPDLQYSMTQVPGLGLFRAPGRLTALTSLGLCLLAGRGFDRAISARRFRVGLALALVFGTAAAAWGVRLATAHELHNALGPGGLAPRLAVGALAWVVSLAALVAWRMGRVGPLGPFVVAALELAALYYGGGRHDWGWAIPPPSRSPALGRLASLPGVGLIAGNLENAPVRAGLTTAYPRLGIVPPPPNYLLMAAKSPEAAAEPVNARWLRRFGVAHGIWDGPRTGLDAEPIWAGPDPILDRLLSLTPDAPRAKTWRVVRYPGAFPPARLALRAVVCADWYELYAHHSYHDDADEVWFTAEDRPPPARGPRARSARLRHWDGRRAIVEHDGACDLVLNRTFDPSWVARVGDGPERPVARGEGGLQVVRIEGTGVSRVALRYRPRLFPATVLSSLATLAALAVLGASPVRGRLVSGRIDR